MHIWPASVAIAGLTCVGLFFGGCASEEQRGWPSETITPLPASYSLGASSISERDDICEAVLRYVVTKPGYKYRFVGFENTDGHGYINHDPSEQLMRRMRELRLPLRPLSYAKWGCIQHGSLVDSEHSAHGVIYYIMGIWMKGADEAEVEVRVEAYAGRGSQFYAYRIIRKNGQWITTEEEPGAIAM